MNVGYLFEQIIVTKNFEMKNHRITLCYMTNLYINFTGTFAENIV